MRRQRFRRFRRFRRRGMRSSVTPQRWEMANLSGNTTVNVFPASATITNVNLFSDVLLDAVIRRSSRFVEIGGLTWYSDLVYTGQPVSGVSAFSRVWESIITERVDELGTPSSNLFDAQFVTLQVGGAGNDLDLPVRFHHRRFATLPIGAENRDDFRASSSNEWSAGVKRSIVIKRKFDRHDALFANIQVSNPSLATLSYAYLFSGTLYWRQRF